LTHEVGHFLGLDHAADSASMMYRWYLAGSASTRGLTADDTAGICAIYPPGEAKASLDCTPRHGFSSECAPNESTGCRCAAPGFSRPSGQAVVLAGLPFALSWLRRRRRRFTWRSETR
jgi:hypothetical protein